MNTFKIILITLLLAVAMSACKHKQDTVNSTVVIERFENGLPKLVREYYSKDSSNYKETQYYVNGQKRIEGKIISGKKEGYWEAWHDNANYWSQGSFKNGLSEGERRVYHENGQLYIVGEYDKGVRIGTWHFYDSLGNEIKTSKYDK